MNPLARHILFTLLVAGTLVSTSLFPAASVLADNRVKSVQQVSIPEQIEIHAHRLMASMRRGDLRSARLRIEHLLTLQKTAHITNLTPVAAAFLSRFDNIKVDEPTDEVYSLAALAVGLAPDYPQLWFNLSRAYMNHGVHLIGPATSALFQGLLAYPRYPRGLVTAIGNISFYLTFAILMMILAVSVILLARHGRTLAHDVGDLFPAAPAAAFSAPEVAHSQSIRYIIQSGLTRTLAFIVMFLVMMLPVAAGLGLIVVALIWTLFIGVYVRRSELTSVIFVHLGVFLVLPLSVLTHLPVELRRVEGPALWTCLKEYCWKDEEDKLNRILIKDPDDPWANAALALQEVHDRPGDPDSLRRAFRQMRAARLDPDGVVAILRGNVQVLHGLSLCRNGKPDTDSIAGARLSFETALRSVPNSPEAYRGLAMVEGLLGNRTALEEAIVRLVDLSTEDDLSFIARIRTLSGSSGVCEQIPAMSAMLRIPSPPDWTTYFNGLDITETPVALAFRPIMLGRLPVRWLPALALISLLLLVSVIFVRKRYSFAYICPRCNGVSCVRCNVGASGFDYCPTCLLEQVRPAFLDPLDLIALQRKQDRKRHWIGFFVPLISLLVPGSGQIMTGRPLRGLVMIGCLSFAFGFVLNPTPVIVDATAYIGSPGTDLPTLPPILLGVVYFWSALDIWLTRRR